MHSLVMHLIRLSEEQRDPDEAEKARLRLIKEFTIVEEQLGKTEYIAADRWTMGDIPMTIRCHRWHLLDVERPDMPNLTRYYKAIQARPAFQAIADPAMHLDG
jgi:glutathione S-transferase